MVMLTRKSIWLAFSAQLLPGPTSAAGIASRLSYFVLRTKSSCVGAMLNRGVSLLSSFFEYAEHGCHLTSIAAGHCGSTAQVCCPSKAEIFPSPGSAIKIHDKLDIWGLALPWLSDR
jgi:hypothetical protein